jgi:hypothetical protein
MYRQNILNLIHTSTGVGGHRIIRIYLEKSSIPDKVEFAGGE